MRIRYASDPEYRERKKRVAREWRQKFPERRKRSLRNGWYKRNYGITLTQYELLSLDRNNRCDNCGDECEKLVVDHDHHTGELRGLLCYSCNVGIGLLGDSLDGLERAMCYLRGHYERNKTNGSQ
jgi:hypothetical protein